MNPLKSKFSDPVKTGEINWDKILKYSTLVMVIVTTFGVVSRARSVLIVAELVDMLVILFLIVLVGFSLIARNKK